jgi:hypothetical protein
VAQEKSTRVLTRLGQRYCRRRTRSHQVAHRFMAGIQNPNFGEFAGAVRPRDITASCRCVLIRSPALIGISDGATTTTQA